MIILTGGAGFIGSSMLSVLNRNGIDDVLIVDSLGTEDKWKNLVGKQFIDILSKEEFRSVFNMPEDTLGKVDAVIHMGACSSTTERDADYLYDNNYLYSVELAEYALQSGARFIYASSAATYGAGEKGYSDEEYDLRPLNMYGYSKHLFDLWMREHGYDERSVGLKFFNVFGPNEYHKGTMASMISKSVRQIQKTGKVSLFKSNSRDYADGGQMRDFVYVKDACEVMWELMNDDSVNGIFNLGSGVASTWLDMTKYVFSAMQIEPNIEFVEMPQDLVGQYQNFTQADMTKLKTALPDVEFDDLNNTIADYVTGHLVSSNMYW